MNTYNVYFESSARKCFNVRLSPDVLIEIIADSEEEAKMKLTKAMGNIVGGYSSGGSDHPCGGNYETQAERFGR